MAQTIYIGKHTPFVGKTVFEILANLKDFGVGRVIQKNIYKKLYPNEPSYFKITHVAPQMDENLQWGRVWGIEIFRGKRYPYIREMKTEHPDYSLIRVHEEPDFDRFPVLGETKDHLIVLPRTIPAPPIMAEVFNRAKLGIKPLYIPSANPGQRGKEAKSISKFDMEAKYENSTSSEFHYWYRIAEEGEKPTLKVPNLLSNSS